LWGYEFAPTCLTGRGSRSRDPDRLLIALGGNRTSAALKTAMFGAFEFGSFRAIDVLLSPVGTVDPPPPVPGVALQILRGVPDVEPLLRSAGTVLTSAGNLCYEALACGAPVCLLAQKQFQADLARRLADEGLAVNAGRAETCSPSDVANALAATSARAAGLSARGAARIPHDGLLRIADIVGRSFVHNRTGS
jgi:hypothetical protein